MRTKGKDFGKSEQSMPSREITVCEICTERDGLRQLPETSNLNVYLMLLRSIGLVLIFYINVMKFYCNRVSVWRKLIGLTINN